MYYLDCYSGVSGDMLLATFLDSMEDKEHLIRILKKAGSIMTHTTVSTKTIDVLGTEARILNIQFEQEHHHIKGQTLKDNLINALDLLGLTDGKEFALNCLETILEAESEAHGEPKESIHLHETGSPDTLVDLCGMGYIYEFLDLKNDQVVATPISVGSGKVKIAHGIVDVPAPATKIILNGLRINKGPVEDELATPTGAAVLKNLINVQIDCVPKEMVPVGRGTGTKRFETQGFVNVLKLYRGNKDRKGISVF